MAKQTKVATVAAPKTTATVGDVTNVSRQAIDKAIAAAQIAQPHAQFIYVNSAGQYHLHHRNGFVKVSMTTGEAPTQRVVRPIKLSGTQPVNPAPQPEPETEDETESEDDVVIPPNDGKEF